jgi:ATP-dependent DNA helicase PIF1
MWRLIWSFLELKECIYLLGSGERSIFENWFRNKTKSCTNEQRVIIRNILFKKQLTPHHLIIGSAGTGKTHVLRTLHNIVEELKHPTTICAFTGLAAQNAGGETLHHRFPMGPYNRVLRTIQGYIFIDEVSMVSADMLRKIITSQDKIKYHLILFGDFLQLPPIPEKQIPTQFLFEYPTFSTLFTKHTLKNPMRQTQTDFLSILDDISWNRFSPKVIRFLLQRSFAFYQLTKEEQFAKLHLFHDRARVDQHNQLCFAEVQEPLRGYGIHFHSILKKTNLGFHFEGFSRRKYEPFTEEEISECVRLQKESHIQCISLKVGCWIMFTRNLYQIKDEKGNLIPIRNGTRGFVTQTERNSIVVLLPHYGLVRIVPQLIHLHWKQKQTTSLKRGCLVRFENQDYIYLDQTDNEVRLQLGQNLYFVDVNQIQVVPRTKSYFFQLEYIPCVLSYALTIHKSEGMTLQDIVLDIDSISTCHLLYVALSRCSKKENVYILGSVRKPSIGVPKSIQQFYSHL